MAPDGHAFTVGAVGSLTRSVVGSRGTDVTVLRELDPDPLPIDCVATRDGSRRPMILNGRRVPTRHVAIASCIGILAGFGVSAAAFAVLPYLMDLAGPDLADSMGLVFPVSTVGIGIVGGMAAGNLWIEGHRGPAVPPQVWTPPHAEPGPGMADYRAVMRTPDGEEYQPGHQPPMPERPPPPPDPFMPDEWPLCPECGADGLYRIVFGLIRGVPEPNRRIQYFGCLGGGSRSPTVGCTACQTLFLGPLANLIPARRPQDDQRSSWDWYNWVPDSAKPSFPKRSATVTRGPEDVVAADRSSYTLVGRSATDLGVEARRTATEAEVAYDLTGDSALRDVGGSHIGTWDGLEHILDCLADEGYGWAHFTFAVDEAGAAVVFWAHENTPPWDRPDHVETVAVSGTLDLVGRVHWEPRRHLAG